jgi:hypothetical protein
MYIDSTTGRPEGDPVAAAMFHSLDADLTALRLDARRGRFVDADEGRIVDAGLDEIL